MSTTDELRRLLDERGVEYYDHATRAGWRFWVDWDEGVGNYTKSVGVDEDGMCYAILEHLTPEQAIEAMLGRGECHVVRKVERIPSEFDGRERDTVLFLCSECGMWVGKVAHYCPNCGRKVVDA